MAERVARRAAQSVRGGPDARGAALQAALSLRSVLASGIVEFDRRRADTARDRMKRQLVLERIGAQAAAAHGGPVARVDARRGSITFVAGAHAVTAAVGPGGRVAVR